MAKKSKAEQLADLIESNPSCQFQIDNDSWSEWYGHSSNYGAGIAEALVILLNRRGFNIKAEAV